MADKCECQKLQDACKTWPSDFFIKLCHMQNWVNLKAKGAHTKYWLFICLVRYLYLFVGFVCFVSFSLFFTFHSRNFSIWNFFTISKSYGITLCIYFYVLYSIVTLLFSLSFFSFLFHAPGSTDCSPIQVTCLSVIFQHQRQNSRGCFFFFFRIKKDFQLLVPVAGQIEPQTRFNLCQENHLDSTDCML